MCSLIKRCSGQPYLDLDNNSTLTYLTFISLDLINIMLTFILLVINNMKSFVFFFIL